MWLALELASECLSIFSLCLFLSLSLSPQRTSPSHVRGGRATLFLISHSGPGSPAPLAFELRGPAVFGLSHSRFLPFFLSRRKLLNEAGGAPQP